MKDIDIARDRAESELSKIINQHVNRTIGFQAVSKSIIDNTGVSTGKIKIMLKSCPTKECPF